MSKILLLSHKKDFASKVLKALSDEGHKVIRELSSPEKFDSGYLKRYDLLILDQNFLLPDNTPLILLISQQIKTATDYPPIIMQVPEKFSNHEIYPEVDLYVTEKVKGTELVEMVENALESRQYLKVGSQYHHASTLDDLNDFFNRELTARDRELSSYTMLMMKKNSELYYIHSCLEKMNTANFTDSVIELKNTIRRFMNEDERIESFFSYFNKTQPDFIAKLDKIASLSLTDKKHCACLKMGLDNKQVAVLFSIDHQSVKKAQTRLKKKLGLAESQSLREFINNV